MHWHHRELSVEELEEGLRTIAKRMLEEGDSEVEGGFGREVV